MSSDARLGLTLLSTAVAVAFAGCGNDSVGALPVLSEGAVVRVNPGLADEARTGIAAARVTADGQLQAYVEAGNCVYPTKIDVEETEATVTLDAYVGDASRSGNCTMQIVPVWVDADLVNPLAGRTVMAAGGDEPLRFVDCVVTPDDRLCK